MPPSRKKCTQCEATVCGAAATACPHVGAVRSAAGSVTSRSLRALRRCDTPRRLWQKCTRTRTPPSAHPLPLFALIGERKVRHEHCAARTAMRRPWPRRRRRRRRRHDECGGGHGSRREGEASPQPAHATFAADGCADGAGAAAAAAFGSALFFAISCGSAPRGVAPSPHLPHPQQPRLLQSPENQRTAHRPRGVPGAAMRSPASAPAR